MSSTSFVMPNDLTDLCRVCLQLPEESQYLDLTTIYDEEDNLTYGECFTICTQIDLSAGEDLPHNLCKSCGLELQMSYDFYKKVEESKRVIEQCQKQLEEQKENASAILPTSAQQDKATCDIDQQHDSDVALIEKYVASDCDEEVFNKQEDTVLRDQTDFIDISENQQANDINIVNNLHQEKINEMCEMTELKDTFETVEHSQESNIVADIEEHLDLEDYQNLEALEEEEKQKILTQKILIKMENPDPPIKNSKTNQAESLPQRMETTSFDDIKIENNVFHEISDQTESKRRLVVPKPIDEIKIENEIISESIVSDNITIAEINPTISNHSRNKTTKSGKILPGPPFECEACGHGLPTKNALYKHRIRKHSRKETYHQNSLAFKCCLCSKYFSAVSLLRRHLDTEHQNMGFVCEYCGHNLPSRNALCQHRIRKHRNTNMKHKNVTSKLKYSQNAEVLNSPESSNSEWRRHHPSSRKRVTTDHVIWFECDDCGHKLPTKNALCQHRLRKHRNRQNAKSFRCKYCEIILTSNRKLQTHLRKSHEILPALKEMVDRL